MENILHCKYLTYLTSNFICEPASSLCSWWFHIKIPFQSFLAKSVSTMGMAQHCLHPNSLFVTGTCTVKCKWGKKKRPIKAKGGLCYLYDPNVSCSCLVLPNLASPTYTSDMYFPPFYKSRSTIRQDES